MRDFATDLRCGAETEVQTTAGRLRGFAVGEVNKFYGIRYATAERFHSPKPVEVWDGVQEAYHEHLANPLAKVKIEH